MSKLLEKSGNKFIFGGLTGIIRIEMTKEFCTGYEKRYSIENYIFDPLLVVAFYYVLNFIKATDAGLSTDESYLNLSTLNDSLQESC